MLDIAFIRENTELVKENCKKRNVSVDIDRLLELDQMRRDQLSRIEELRAQRNQGSQAKPSEEEIAQMRSVGDEIRQKESQIVELEKEYHTLLMQVPNMTHPDSPAGGEDDFTVLDTVGEAAFSFTPKDHEQLLLDHDMIDFERGAKVTGSKFYFAKGDLVRLNQALIQLGIDIVTSHGYALVETPDIAKNTILEGIGFNPRGEETQVYSIEDTDLSLIGTAEITVGGFHADEIIDLSNGPVKYVALSHCFRTEAGAYGRESKGLYRVHQFTKLEMFVFCKPEESEALHTELLQIEKEICDSLEIPYRVIDIATGDLGGPAYRKYDIEAWMTMKDGYGEITSTSNCTDYQARRLKIRYKDEDGKNQFVHTLNGTAIVSSRFPIAVLENHQQEDGSIKIPVALRPHFGKDSIKK